MRWLEMGTGRVLAVERGRLRLVLRVVQTGPVADRRRVIRGLARWPGITVVTPETPVTGFGLIPLITPLHHAVWELGPDVRSAMAGKWRNRLVAAERAGVRVRRGGRDCLEALLLAEGRQRRARAAAGPR